MTTIASGLMTATAFTGLHTGEFLPPLLASTALDTLADQVLIGHMLQHIIIGDVSSLLIVLGLTGPMLQPHCTTGRPDPCECWRTARSPAP